MTRHLICTALACLMLAPAHAETDNFCAELPRAANAGLERHPASTEWFEVHEVEPGIFGILEPQQRQEVISWLVVGSDKALLIDTGNGIGDIASIVRSLTDKPVTVINTHSHYDHVGGNHQFEQVAALDSDYGRANAGGYANALVHGEVSAENLCRPTPDGVTEEEHVIHPYAVGEWVQNGHRFDIGGRVLEVLHIPGHSPDSIALFEPATGFLWSGDTYYPGDIWLFDPATDYAEYQRSMALISTLADKLTRVFPAHNVLIAAPSGLVETRDAYERILRGEAQGVPDEEPGVLRYDFGTISFLMQSGHPRRQ